MSEKVFESTHIIRFPDCDPFNHLNNARYIDYFINAREDHLLKFHSFNLYEYAQKTGTSWVVGQNQIAYFAPAKLMEKAVIQSTLLEISNKSVRVELRMLNERKDQLKALLWTSFIHYDLKTLKPLEHNQYINDIFKPYENPLEGPLSFDERIQQVKKK